MFDGSSPHAASRASPKQSLYLIGRTLTPAARGRSDYHHTPLYLPRLDRWLFQHVFEAASARRYSEMERPAFGDLDQRLLDRMALVDGTRLLDLGCGPGAFAAVARERHPGVEVIPVEPSRDFACPGVVRARAEALPLADRSIDVAICLSSIRHVRDRAATLAELRRVVTDRLWIVELDPIAERARIAAHADRLGSAMLRRTFGPLVVRTAPPSSVIAELARAAEFTLRSLASDPIQPVYIMELA